MAPKLLEPLHPGEILKEEFLKEFGITQYRLAKDINVPARRINEIVLGKRGITADTALRLARYFGTSEEFWVNLQTWHDLEVARRRHGARLDREIIPLKRSAAAAASNRRVAESRGPEWSSGGSSA